MGLIKEQGGESSTTFDIKKASNLRLSDPLEIFVTLKESCEIDKHSRYHIYWLWCDVSARKTSIIQGRSQDFIIQIQIHVSKTPWFPPSFKLKGCNSTDWGLLWWWRAPQTGHECPQAAVPESLPPCNLVPPHTPATLPPIRLQDSDFDDLKWGGNWIYPESRLVKRASQCSAI